MGFASGIQAGIALGEALEMKRFAQEAEDAKREREGKPPEKGFFEWLGDGITSLFGGGTPTEKASIERTGSTVKYDTDGAQPTQQALPTNPGAIQQQDIPPV